MSIENREKNVAYSRTFRIIRSLYCLSDKAVLDVGCGFGEYLRFFGSGSMGITTTAAEIEYAKNHNLTVLFGNAELLGDVASQREFDAVWANNLFEHLLSPHAFLMKLKKLSHGRTILILGVPVVPKIVSLLSLGRFRGALATNHINFFTYVTLRLTAERAGWTVAAARPFSLKAPSWTGWLHRLLRTSMSSP